MKRFLLFCLLCLPLFIAAQTNFIIPKAPLPGISPRAEKSAMRIEETTSSKAGNSTENKKNIFGNILEGETKHKVTIYLDYDSLKFAPPIIKWLTPNDMFESEMAIADRGQEKLEISVAEGKHDFIARFMPWYKGDDLPAYSYIDAYTPYSYIVVEDVNVKEYTEFTIDVSKATNLIKFSPVNNEGESFQVPLLKIDEQAQTMEWDYSKANVWDVCYITGLYDNEAGMCVMDDIGSYHHIREDGRSYADASYLYINSLSEKYTIYQNLMAYNSDTNTAWSLNLATRADTSKTVCNTRNEYTCVPQEFLPTPAFDSDRCESPYGCEMEQFFNSKSAGGYSFKFFDTKIPTFYLAQAADYSCDFKSQCLLTPQGFEFSSYDQNIGEWTAIGIDGCPLSIVNGETRYVNPYSDYYSSKAPHSGWVMGQGVPTTFVPFETDKIDLNIKAVVPNPKFLGQFGENITIDLLNTNLNVTLDGKTVCNSIFDLYDWCYEFAEDGHQEGTVTMTFVNDNIRLGDIRGTNKTEITYHEGSEDLCPPVMQLIRFTQTMNEKYGPELDSTFGNITFPAGDINSDGKNAEYKEAEVKVEYAVNGTTDFIPLEVKITRPLEENQLPVYLIPMTKLNMENKSPNGWFDFRITVTDEAGNSMTQTYSPAVYINKLQGESSLNEIMADDKDSEYYDVLGRRVVNPQPGSLVIEKSINSHAAKRVFNYAK